MPISETNNNRKFAGIELNSNKTINRKKEKNQSKSILNAKIVLI